MEIGLNFISNSQYTTVRWFENWPEQNSYTINWTLFISSVETRQLCISSKFKWENYEFYLNIYLKIEK